ncbi:pyridoxamine 5'-phosphate oxidase [Sulfitobacter sp. SK012]|uniref:pyridoxamine 5'-phosphate oxidase family protein n=1 Tax=Sulfitobacter sp. SK012 TaxID=1389005 RepID=UPI000E0AC493|nr:pyridoxamine 5'-phosphate oxidase family protein [Sulfitobacter sp. SK012]AXI45441.1 pyridoxamine 5'-phosphate oxidase [Sulfitobacter sp. SK012]
MKPYGDIMFTPTMLEAQARAGSQEANLARYQRLRPEGLGPDEVAFLQSRTTIYMATVTADGWPYVQHRGGPVGFLKVLNPQTIGFTDYRGNRQFITTGNLVTDDRVSIFAMDYARKARLKLQGHGRMIDAADDPDLAAQLATPGQGRVERIMTITLAAFDWNCPQYITPRFDTAEMTALVGPELTRLETRNAELEAELAQLRAQLGATE